MNVLHYALAFTFISIAILLEQAIPQERELVLSLLLFFGIAVAVILTSVIGCNRFFLTYFSKLRRNLIHFLPPTFNFFWRGKFFVREQLPEAICFEAFGQHDISLRHSSFLLIDQILAGSDYFFGDYLGLPLLWSAKHSRNFSVFVIFFLGTFLFGVAIYIILIIISVLIKLFDLRRLIDLLSKNIKSIEFCGIKIEFN